jgi:hypothetical protein
MTEINCTERNSSTVAPQSLMLMNSQFITDFSNHIAKRLQRDHDNDPTAQIKLAWRLVYGRLPSDTEASDALSFLENQRRVLAAPPTAAKPVKGQPAPEVLDDATLSLATFCQALLSSNEFLYLN